MLGATDRVLGFVENSSDPDDLQAWCDDCKEMSLRVRDELEAFLAFNDMKIVCDLCYARFKQIHART